MTIPAKVSASEVMGILVNRYVGQQFQARLINLPAYNYDPNTAGADQTLLNGEVTLGTGGYQRPTLSYTSSDLGSYADGGVPLVQKATTFAHDGSATPITFSHIALTWSSGGAATLGAVTTNPATAAVASYTDVPVSTGSRVGLTVDITVASNVFSVAINTAGVGYQAADTVTISNAKLKALDPTITDADDLTFTISTVDANGGATALGAVTTSPSTAADATHTDVGISTPVDRGGLKVDIDVTAGPAFAVTISDPGYGYEAADTITVSATDLNALDPTIPTSDPDLTFTVATVTTPTLPTGVTVGDLFTAVKTTSTVNLTGGSEAAFYWNIKQFGFYSTSA